MTSKQLSRRQARWSEFLSRFDFQIEYTKGKYCKPDALTRRQQDLPHPDQRFSNQTILKAHNLHPNIRPKEQKQVSTVSVTPVRILTTFLERQSAMDTCITQAYEERKDNKLQSVLEALRGGRNA